MEMASVLVIDQENSDIKRRLERIPGIKVVGVTSNADIGFAMAQREEPTIIMLNVDLEEDNGFAIAEAFAMEFPASSLILMTTRTGDTKVFQQALKVGAKEVLTLPVEDGDLAHSIQQVIKIDLVRRNLFSIEKKVKPEFKIITVFNTKGGVGKTTIALNLAMAIRQKTKSRVVLVDLDLYSGNVALMAGVESRLSIKDMVDDIHMLDKESLDEYCVHHKSGLKILPAPIQPEMASFVKTEHVERIIKLLSEVFNYVIIDAPTYFTDTVIPALEMAQDIIVVSTVDLASAQNLKQCLDLLDRLSMLNKARLVVNRLGYTGALKTKDLENQLGLAIQTIIPECEKVAIDAVNMGEPLVLSAASAPCSEKILDLADLLIGEYKKKGFSFFGKGR